MYPPTLEVRLVFEHLKHDATIAQNLARMMGHL
jgi:hypothetical protein